MAKIVSLDRKYRALDLSLVAFIAPFCILIFGPLIFVLLLAQGRPVFFCCKRVAPHGSFSMLKFRSMVLNAPLRETTEEMNNYVTPLGRFIRRTSIDELPQLINVVMGSMSLVGPRPCLPSQKDLVEMRAQRGLDQCCPGITGLAQVRGRDFISLRHKVRYEHFYAEKRSIGLYFWVLGLTVKAVFFGKGVRY